MVDDNEMDAMAAILELLDLQPGIQHDQHEVLSRLVDKLVVVIFSFFLHNFRTIFSGLQIRSESFLLIQAPDCKMHQSPSV